MRCAKSTHSLLRHELHQVLLDLRGVGVLREAEPVAEPRDVRIDDHARRHAVAVPSTTLAVLRPTPGSATICSMSRGTSPSYLSTSSRLQALMFFALLRKKPVL